MCHRLDGERAAELLTTKSLKRLRTDAPLLLYLGKLMRLVTVYVT